MLRCGLENMLKHLPGLHIQIIDIGHDDILLEALKLHKPDILIINPLMPGFANTSVGQLRDETGLLQLKCIALLAAIVPDELVKQFDDYISLYHDFDEIKLKLEALLHAPDEEEPDEDETQNLSSREKEIVICVVKGMTNREIADRLCISAHTVITHRRNIARKLQIHTASGLTIYAIVNKLVELSEISVKSEE